MAVRLEIAAEVAAAAEITASSTPIAASTTEVAASVVVTAASAVIAAEVAVIAGRGVSGRHRPRKASEPPMSWCPPNMEL